MKFSNGNEIGIRICEMLGVDPNTVQRIQIDISVGEKPAIHVHSLFPMECEPKLYGLLKVKTWTTDEPARDE